MARSPASDRSNSPRRAWHLGVGVRLLLAFFLIVGFAALAAAAGMYAFRAVGDRLEVVDARIPPTLSALELSRSAERIIAAAPALLAAADRAQRDRVSARLDAEIKGLEARLEELKEERTQAQPLDRIEPVVSALTANFADLDDLVTRRLAASERVATLRHGVFEAHEETQRLLAPWLEVLRREIAISLEADRPTQLASLIERQRLMRTAQAQAAAVTDMLSEASTTEEPRRLEVLGFQLGLGLHGLKATAEGLDPKLRPLFLEQVQKLTALAQGPEGVAEVRSRELALISEGQALLAEAGRLSAELTAAVDRLGSTAKQDIGAAIAGALSVQRLSTQVLMALVALSLVTSLLIVWLYVGRNIVRRLDALSDSMRAIAGGRLDTPIPVGGGDEIAAMAGAVEVFRQKTLERDGFEIANRYKSQFLASASHDLRQPLHALNLFMAQLRAETDPEQRERLVARMSAAVTSMNELFDALLDMSKLDAGLLEPHITEFPIATLLRRLETTFAEAAREKRLRLKVVHSSAWVRSDFILLERILLNLVANAVRHTTAGGVVVGCRRRGEQLRIDVCDSGQGIPEGQQRAIFAEFVQLPTAQSDGRGGLGLGLSIVERLGQLLEHRIEVRSRAGRGSRFSASVPIAAAASLEEAPATFTPTADPARGKCIVVIEDDALVREGMAGMLRSWGCQLVTADSAEAAMAKLAAQALEADLIICDYRLAGGKTGLQAIARLRREFGAAIPAFLVSGDTAPERQREVREHGLHLLHKPVAPMRLRAMVNQLLASSATTQAAE